MDLRSEEGRVNVSALKHPSATLPLAMSVLALATVFAHIALVGTPREPDEGAAAHIFQLLIVAQLPIMVFFAMKWLRRAPRQALLILSLQVAAVLVALTPVFYFGL